MDTRFTPVRIWIFEVCHNSHKNNIKLSCLSCSHVKKAFCLRSLFPLDLMQKSTIYAIIYDIKENRGIKKGNTSQKSCNYLERVSCNLIHCKTLNRKHVVIDMFWKLAELQFLMKVNRSVR